MVTSLTHPDVQAPEVKLLDEPLNEAAIEFDRRESIFESTIP